MAKKKPAEEPYDPEDHYFAVATPAAAAVPAPVSVSAPVAPVGTAYYPKVKYHATEPPQTVHTPEGEACLGAGWGDSPAEFVKPSKE